MVSTKNRVIVEFSIMISEATKRSRQAKRRNRKENNNGASELSVPEVPENDGRGTRS
jgi:hypothetical protein